MVAQLKELLGIGVLVLAILGCQPATPTASIVDNSAALTLTSLVQTLTAPPASATPVVVIDVSSTFPAESFPTATEFPPTIEATAALVVITPTLTIAPLPSVPMASVTVGTNCRSGPGREYEIIGGAQVGIEFMLVGRNTQTNYWIILLPDGRECWLWGEHAIVEGNVASLPEYAIPAPPLPQFGSVQGTVDVLTLGGIETFAGIQVKLIPSGLITQTDSLGQYFFASVPVGEVIVSFSYSAYRFNNTPAFTVQAGQPATAPRITGTRVVITP